MAKLNINPEHTVAATNEVRPRTMRTKRRVMPPTIPPADIVAPKHIAQTISQMVSIMPAMPRVAIRPDSMALDVGNDVLPYMLIIEALNRSGWMSRNTSVWKKRPNNIANRVERKRVTNGGQRRAIITPVRSGTRSSQGVI